MASSPPSPPGKVIWITGLSGAGKTTLANTLVPLMRARGLAVVQLDGDELRDIFAPPGMLRPTGHSRPERVALATQYSHLCRMLAAQGINVVIATISMFKEIHQWNRENIADYFEIYLNVSIDQLRQRDPKGIYKKHHLGLLTNVAGLDLEVDEPLSPDWTNAQGAVPPPENLANELLAAIFPPALTGKH